MDKGLIPNRYAKALYERGAERGSNAALYAIMQRLCEAFAAEPSLASTVSNPFVAVADKVKLLDTAAGAGESDKTFADFLKLLAQNGRLDLAREIARAFVDMYRREHGIYKVVVTSAAPLGEDEKKRLDAVVANYIGKGTMEYDYVIDPALIGGFTVMVNNRLLDASVSSQLRNIRRSLVD